MAIALQWWKSWAVRNYARVRGDSDRRAESADSNPRSLKPGSGEVYFVDVVARTWESGFHSTRCGSPATITSWTSNFA